MSRNDNASPVAAGEAQGDYSSNFKVNHSTVAAAECAPGGVIAPCLPAIPNILKGYPKRWAPWEAVWDPRRGKFDKVPKCADKTSAGVSTHNAWWTFKNAVAGYEVLNLVAEHGGGIGFNMTKVQNLVGIDLDRCVLPDGQVAGWAQEIVIRSGSYAERSPSGNGLRIFVAGTVPQDWNDHERGIECYAGHEARFLTVTGRKLDGCPDDVQEAPEGFLDWLQAEYPPKVKEKAVEVADLPDLLDESAVPSLDTLGLPAHALAFLRDGEHNGDGSRAVTAVTRALYEATASSDGKLDDALVLSILHSNPHAWELALNHRRQDEDRALEYLWKHHCLPQRARAVPAITDFDAMDQARREHQKGENERIGEGELRYPMAEVMPLEVAINRFVFLSDGSRVADIFNPHYDLAFSDWAATHAASKESVPQPDKVLKDGTNKPVPDKLVSMAELWRASPKRKTAVCRTFKAAGAPVLPDPEGRLALNTWKPFDRVVEVLDIEASEVGLFLDHVAFLFGEDAPRFLDWLAHIEQRPDVLPHTGWLHIAKNFGLGRNWLESVLTRVWAGAVAANLDLVAMLKDGFNGRLSRKVLAVVDEIREGGRDSQWEHSEKLKSTITEETRLINPKYGRQFIEFNACRWLMFSNHLSAIPLESNDRRIEVVYSDAMPKGAEYYTRLYNVLSKPQFIAAVAKLLGERDISRFNPGAHAAHTDAKRAAAKASQTPMAAWCEMLVEHWPSDLITSQQMFDVVAGDGGAGSLTAAHRRTLEQFGIEALGRPVKVDNRPTRLSILRNKAKWKSASSDELRDELRKAEPGIEGSREYLMGFAAADDEGGGC